MYEIVARWTWGGVEVVDTADTREEANALLEEYRMAYGGAATLSVKKAQFQKYSPEQPSFEE
jgi:hypothetical protein